MAVLLLDYYEGGNIGKTAAFSLDADGDPAAVLLGITALAFARRCAGQRPRRLTINALRRKTMKRRTCHAGR